MGYADCDSMRSVNLNLTTLENSSYVVSVVLGGSMLEPLCLLLFGVELCKLISKYLGLCQSPNSLSRQCLVPMIMVSCISITPLGQFSQQGLGTV